MKSLTRTGMLMLTLVCLTILSSCGDDEKEKPKNQVKVDGKTFDFNKGYIVSIPVKNDDDVVVGSVQRVFLAGGNIELEDNLILSGEGPLLEMWIVSEDHNDLDEGEYDMQYDDLDFGNVMYLDLYDNFSLEVVDEAVVEVYDAWYSGDTDGEVTVSKDGVNHVFKIDLGEYYFLGDSDDDETEDLVDEDLTGYFKGELEVLTVEEETPARKASDRRTSRIHKSIKFN